MSDGEQRLYPFQPGQGYFDAGVTEEGRQVLMGLLCPHLVAVFFDHEGNLLGIEERRLEFLAPINGIYNIYDERITSRLRAWQDEFGFRPLTIRVKKFCVDKLKVYIEDEPEYFAELLADPGASETEKASVRETRQRWQADGQFVFVWGNDYWLDGTGEVTDS